MRPSFPSSGLCPLLIMVSAFFHNIACMPSFAIIGQEIVVTTRHPTFRNNIPSTASTPPSAAAPAFTTKSPDRGPTEVRINPITPQILSSTRRVNNKSKLQDQSTTPTGRDQGRLNVSVPLDEVLLRVKRRPARGGGFGSAGGGQRPRDRLNYNSSSMTSVSRLLLIASILICMLIMF